MIRRREDPRLLAGLGQFVDDLKFRDCLHVAVVRSPHAHARIRAIDTTMAAKLPGVDIVLDDPARSRYLSTGRDLASALESVRAALGWHAACRQEER